MSTKMVELPIAVKNTDRVGAAAKASLNAGVSSG
jgi:hypothetical protein